MTSITRTADCFKTTEYESSKPMETPNTKGKVEFGSVTMLLKLSPEPSSNTISISQREADVLDGNQSINFVY